MSSSNNKKNEGRQGSGARTAGIFIAGVIVGLIIGWGWFSLGRDNGTVATTDDTGTMTSSSSESATSPSTVSNTGTKPTTGTTGSTATGSNALTVAPLQNAGLSVALSSVSVKAPTWVVIFDNVSGKPGNALGARMFFPGDTTGSIDLLRGTVAGQSYFAGEYVDNGDHKFSKQADTQVNASNGSQMLVEFSVR